MMDQHARIRVALAAISGFLLLCSSAYGQVCERPLYSPEERIFEKSNDEDLPLSWSHVADIQAKTIFGDSVGRVCAAYSEDNLTELFGFKVAFGRLEYLIPLDAISRGGKNYEIGDSPASEIPGQFSNQGFSHLYSISVGLLAREDFVAESSKKIGTKGPEGGLSEYSAYILRVDITDKISIRSGSEEEKPSRHVLTLVNEWNRHEARRNIFLVPSPESLTDRLRIKQISFGTTSPQASLVQEGLREIIQYKVVKTHTPASYRRRGLFGRLRGRTPGFSSYVYQPFATFEPIYKKVEDLEGVRSVIRYQMGSLKD